MLTVMKKMTSAAAITMFLLCCFFIGSTDRVEKPTVTMKCTDSNTSISFTCNVGQSENFEWFMDDVKLKEKQKTLMRAAKDVANARFYCNVSNAVSSEISLPVKQNCYDPDSQGGCDQYAATGTSITVALKYTLKESDTLKWRHNTTFIFKRRNKTVIQGKNDDVDSTRSLKLTKLTKDKSGQYTPVVYNADGKRLGNLTSLTLCVIDFPDGCDQTAATGTNLTVPLNFTLKESDTLKWWHNTTLIFKRKNKNVTRGKIDDVDATGSLKLTKLTRDKSGRYTPVVYNEGGESVGDLHTLRLCVLDRVQKPTVTMKCTDSNTSISFTCNVGQNENFEWFMDDVKFKEKQKTLMRAAKHVANARFYCNVSNAVSSEISLPVKQNCYDPDSQHDCNEYAATGTNLTVPLKYTLKESDTLKWRHNTTFIFKRRNKTVIRGKNYHVDSTGSLKLTKLTKDKSGRYTPMVYNEGGKSVGDLGSMHLCVIDSRDGCDLYAASGDAIVVPLNHKLHKVSALKWKHNDKTIFYQRKIKSLNPTFVKGKKEDINPDGSLKLTSLKANDSGIYIAGVFNQDGTLENNLKTIRLCVLARVQKPRVKMMCSNNSDVKFTCAVSQNENNFKIEWLMDNKKLEEKGKMLTRAAKDVLNASFSCNVSNPISSEISLPVKQNCYDPGRETNERDVKSEMEKDGRERTEEEAEMLDLKDMRQSHPLPSSQDRCDKYAAAGTSFTVTLKHAMKKSENLRWHHNEKLIFNSKLDKGTQKRDFVVDSTGSLNLTKLTKDSSGCYTPEVFDRDGISVGELPSLSLCVLDRVQKPNVTMKCSASKINVSFTCNVAQKDNKLEYKWLIKDEELKGDLKDTITQKAENVANSPIVCNVSNPVSYEISDPVYQECLKLYEKIGIYVVFSVRLGAGIFLLLILIAIVCYVQTRTTKAYRIKDKEELPLQWTNQEQQHHQEQQCN